MGHSKSYPKKAVKDWKQKAAKLFMATFAEEALNASKHFKVVGKTNQQPINSEMLSLKKQMSIWIWPILLSLAKTTLVLPCRY